MSPSAFINTPSRSVRSVLSKSLLAALCLWAGATLEAKSILFVGNSFTFYPTAVTGPGGLSGVAEILDRLTEQGGLKDVEVAMRTDGGRSLAWHLANNRAALGARSRDIVVLQDLSTGPLSESGLAAFDTAVAKIAGILREQNPEVRIYLYETWARPDLVVSGRFRDLTRMQDPLRLAYGDAVKTHRLAGMVPVGDAFIKAVEWGHADDPSTPVREGELSLWNEDKYHQNTSGAYLSAVLFYHHLVDGDIDAIPAGAGSVAASLGIGADEAARLHAVARRISEPAPGDKRPAPRSKRP